MVTKELDFVYITEDGKRFLLKEKQKSTQKRLKMATIIIKY